MAKLAIIMEVKGPDWDGEYSAEMEEQIKEGMDRLAEEVEWLWRQKAAETLNTSRQEYLDGLAVQKGDGEFTVTLSGWLPVAVEQGMDRFDMKPGLLGNAPFRKIGLQKGAPEGPGGKTVFRMVAPHQTNWWHPGIQARAIGEQVKQELPTLAQEIFGKLGSKITF